MLSILLSYDTRLKKSFDPNLIICLFDSYKDLTQFSIACLLPSLRSLPSRISAPGADGCNSCTVFPNPLPPDVAKSGGGQILVCVAGRGYYQVEGKEAVEMKPGDCINIPTGVKHWHGAAPDEWFSHLAIEVPSENGSNEWLEPVSDEEYRKLK